MRLMPSVRIALPSMTDAAPTVKTRLPNVAMSLLMIVTRVVVWLPSSAPPEVGPESVTSNVSFGSEMVSRMIGTTISLLVSPSANDSVPLVPT